MPEELLYIGSKLIRGFPCDRQTFLRNQARFVPPNEENQHGYQLIHPDGYVSWLPKQAFENAYRVVTDSERALF